MVPPKQEDDNIGLDFLNQNFQPEQKVTNEQEIKKELQKELQKEAAFEESKPDKKKSSIDDLLKVKPISFLNNVPMRITAELSRANITMKDLLSYKKSSIIPLEKLAGEPMDIMINGEYMAKGEVVVVNNNYAVRLTDLIEKLEIVNRQFNEVVS